MEKRDAFLLFVLAGAGAYAVHANWDTLRVELGLDDLSPQHTKAIRLAKDAFTFAPTTANWVTLRDRAANGEIEVAGEPWRATGRTGSVYHVTCTWTEDGRQRVHGFAVDIGRSTVEYEGLEGGDPAPR
jgi:hypothetical protein